MFSPIKSIQIFAILACFIYLVLNESMKAQAALNPQDLEALTAASRSLQADLSALPGQLARNPKLSSLDSDDDEEDDDRYNVDENPQSFVTQQTAAQQQVAAAVTQPTADLSGAASGYHRHHHGHHAKGWLDMGAWSGKKGAFGWHDKHPVGKKGRK